MRYSRWMVCNVRGEPVGFKSYATSEEAYEALSRITVGDYHVRPVDIVIVVRGQAPQPWCHRVMPNGSVVDL